MTKREKQMLSRLKSLGRPEAFAGMAHFGIDTENAFGVAVPELRRLAKEIGPDHPLALAMPMAADETAIRTPHTQLFADSLTYIDEGFLCPPRTPPPGIPAPIAHFVAAISFDKISSGSDKPIHDN